MLNIKIPSELIDQLSKGNVVFFVGIGIYKGKVNCPPNSQELAADLKQACDYPDTNLDIGRIAQYFEDSLSRSALVDFWVNQFDNLHFKPQLTHDICAKLPIKIFITTNYDSLLEAALANSGKAYTKVVSDIEVPFIDETKINIIKLHGDIQQRNTLVITRDDYSDFFTRRPSIAETLGFYAATKTLIFLGYSLDDNDFQNICLEVTRNLGKFKRQAYAVQFESSLVDKKYWGKKGIIFIDGEIDEFLSQLFNLWKQSQSILDSPQKQDTSSLIRSYELIRNPYKFLDFYETEESDLFFGRDVEIRQLIQKILSHRITILVGKSGIGKTSLIKAGVIPKLSNEGFVAIYARCGDSPDQAIVRAVSAQPNLRYQYQSDHFELSNFLDGVSDHAQSGIIVFLDQFEEFFSRTSKETRQNFTQELAYCIEICGNTIRFVLSIREDFLAELYEFNAVIPRIFANTYVLGNLSYQGASDAVINPLKLVEMECDEELVEQILYDLNGGTIFPPQLQIVCQKLYENVRYPSKILSLSTYLELGKASRILSEYLDQMLTRFPKDQMALAKDILKQMVSSKNTRQPLRVNKTDNEKTKQVLSELINYRLVRFIDIKDETYYELAHEYMIEKILQWFSVEELVVQDVLRLLDQEFDNWQKYQLLISNNKLEIIYRQHENPYLRLDEAAVRLLIKSCLHNGHDRAFPDWLSQIRVWLDKAEFMGISQLELLKVELRDTDSNIRMRTVQALHTVVGDPALDELISHWKAEYDPKVKEQIVTGLGNIHSIRPDSIDILCQGLKDPYPSIEYRARTALTEIEDPIAQEAIKNYRPKGMILIPEGEFWMGSDMELDERPKHKRNLRAYYIDRFPVTNAEYAKYIKVTGYHSPSHWKDNSYSPGKDNYPVDNITLEDAKHYAEWAGKRLPTEAEWEKAARGLDERDWPWGNEFDPRICNVDSDGPKPIGYYSPYGDSPFGVGDMAGNVMEWTISKYQPYDNTDAYGGYKNRYGQEYIVLRGGGFRETARASRCSARRTEFPDSHRSGLGFRCVLDCF